MNLDDIVPKDTYDVLIFGDVLEHLRNPRHVLTDLEPCLKANGWVVISVPNMQHIEAIWRLAVKGFWPNNPRGIFDGTHLRVFTRKNLLGLIGDIGLQPIVVKRNFRFRDRQGSTFPFYGRLLKWAFPDYYTFQYVCLSQKLR
jgi:SAM-dependent methyltransferase